MTTTADFRILLSDDAYAASFQSMEQYRTALLKALATPPPEPPTDDELNALWNCCGDYDEEGDHYGNIFQFARAVLKMWGAK
jgi:hypothetical protein